MAEIELRGVSKRFAGNIVVNEASFTIHDGEFFILVGPSGCGKSTLLNVIVGLEEASAGEILLDGVRINDVDPKDRNMAMVFQSYALYPHMTVRENMAFPLRLAGMTKRETDERIAQTAEILELAALLDRKPAALSGGQRQRVAMGRAIVREPAVFLLDEPLSNLDAKLRAQMRTEIARLQRRLGTTTIYVTHDQTEAMTLGDRIAVLRGGEVLQIGTPRELYEQPATLFVAEFIGSPVMNFLPARSRGGALELPVGILELSGELRERVAAADEPLVVGFRPDHLNLGRREVPGDLCFEAHAEVVEWLGADIYIYMDVALSGFAVPNLLEERDIGRGDALHRTLVARIDPGEGAPAQEGETLHLWLDPRHIHVFNASTGRSLLD